MEFSFKEIVALMMKRFLLISVCTFSGLFLFLLVSSFIVRPSYTASVQLYVNPNDKEATTATLSELDYAQKVVTTYINFLKTKVFYKQVADKSTLEYTPEEIRNMTSIYAVNNTEIFQVSVTSHSPDDSYQLVYVMQQVAPRLIKSIKDTAEISVVDPVVLPTSPSEPNVLLNSLIGGFLGFIISVAVSFIWEIIDVNVKNQEDLTKKYSMPVLGNIPSFDEMNRERTTVKRIMAKLQKSEQKKTDKPIDENTKFLVTEAYKAFRTNLRFSLRKEGCKKIIVSSPVPEDGKSTTSTNLAITIAQTNSKVLLLDCDLRKGRLHNFFGIKSSPGISDCLSGMIDVEETIYSTSHDNLYVMPMGSIPPNPTELMASKQMEDLIQRLEKEYDYIIMDTPPVNVVSDSLSLVKLVDGVVLVVREGMTSHPNIEGALTKYKFAETNLLGFVLNGVALNAGKSYKSRYYYYHAGDKDD
jgi:capsular exopolysaccharide synthesis family protein